VPRARVELRVLAPARQAARHSDGLERGGLARLGFVLGLKRTRFGEPEVDDIDAVRRVVAGRFAAVVVAAALVEWLLHVREVRDRDARARLVSHGVGELAQLRPGDDQRVAVRELRKEWRLFDRRLPTSLVGLGKSAARAPRDEVGIERVDDNEAIAELAREVLDLDRAGEFLAGARVGGRGLVARGFAALVVRAIFGARERERVLLLGLDLAMTRDDLVVLLLVGDLAKIRPGVEQLDLGEIVVLDVEGKPAVP